MAELAGHFEALGLKSVSSFINSGNVLFETKARSLPKLAHSIASGLEPLLGFRSDVFLRTQTDVHAIARRAVSHRRKVPQSGEVNVAFMERPPSQEQVSALGALRTSLDDFAHEGSEIYWLCRGNQMDSTFSGALLERRLRVRCTFRRVSMLEKLSLRLRGAKE